MGDARFAVRLGRALVALTCLVAATVAWSVSAPRADATEDVTAQRLAGANRYATAGGIALTAHPDGAATVVLASGESYPDALAGAALAGALAGPLLLTPRDTLAPEAREAIEQLGAEAVVILGGPGAVSDAIERDLDEELDVTRVSGADRFATAAEAARAIGADSIASYHELTTAIVASGRSFADALAAGGIASSGDGTSGVHPVLLVDDTVPASTAAAIDELGIQQVLILGGSAAVSSASEAELEELTGNPALRVAGNDRYETGVAVAELMVSDFGSPATTVLLASGESFADALAGGVLSGRAAAPILLTPQVALADSPEAFLVDHATTVGQIVALGGTTAVSQTALDQAETAAETVPEEEAAEEDAEETPITVSPTGSASQQNTSTRSYSASGLAGLSEVDVVLLPCANVTATSSGHAFKNTNTNAIADNGSETGSSPDRATTVARITSVNGAAASLTNDDYADDVEPKSDGTITFSVSGPTSSTAAGGCVRPVVFDDADGDSALATTTDNPATGAEDLGVGGSTTFNPQSASGGSGSGSGSGTSTPPATSYPARYVVANDETANSYAGCEYLEDTELQDPRPGSSNCDTFFYDSNDVFKLSDNKTMSMIEFETRLSDDDEIVARYYDRSRSNLVSTFTLSDSSPGRPEILDARETSNGVQLVMRESQTAADWYNLYRSTKTGTACPTNGEVFLAELPDGEQLDDDEEAAELPAPMEPYVDGTVEPGTTYCYYLYAVHQNDESTPDTAEVTTEGEAPDDGDMLPTIDDLVAFIETESSSTLPDASARARR